MKLSTKKYIVELEIDGNKLVQIVSEKELRRLQNLKGIVIKNRKEVKK